MKRTPQLHEIAVAAQYQMLSMMRRSEAAVCPLETVLTAADALEQEPPSSVPESEREEVYERRSGVIDEAYERFCAHINASGAIAQAMIKAVEDTLSSQPRTR